MIEKQQPPSGDVFEMTNGEKIRIEYNNVFMYKSSSKTKTTTVELGYAPNTETIILDISFDTFDEKYQANKKAWNDYWNSNSSFPY